MALVACVLSNMILMNGVMRKFYGEDGVAVTKDTILVFEPYTIQEEDIRPNFPDKWKVNIKSGKRIMFAYQGQNKLFYEVPIKEVYGRWKLKLIGKIDMACWIG